ncbi:MAG: S8 family serine peptidase [Lachnospiraceae bacterium]|nr:S8 family serine peptidase [Lachnospiraceae bacterium]
MKIWKRSAALLTAMITAAVTLLGNPYAVRADESIIILNEDPALIVEDSIELNESSVLPGEGSAISVEGTDITPDTFSGKEDLPYGLYGMPEGFSISSEDISEKQKAKEKGMLSSLSDMTEGVDYVRDQIVYSANDKEYAEQVARAYNAELISFSYGIAVARITDPDLSVAEAVAAGLDTDIDLPIVSPNHITALDDPDALKDSLTENKASVYESVMPAEGSAGWEDAARMFDDPALRPGYEFESKNAWEPSEQGTITDGYQWMHDMVGTYEAWWTSTGNSSITVAVIDTGVDTAHEDLQSIDGGRWVRNTSDPYQAPEPGSQLLDDSGHGTHVAGIVAATAGNGKGGAGIAPNVNILGIQIGTYYNGDKSKKQKSSSNFTDDNIARAINYVAGYSPDGKTPPGSPRADIINLSLGGTGYNRAVDDSIDNAYKQRVTVVASMGNPDTNTVFYPAYYDHVIAVAAIDQAGNRTFFSSYGDWADIAAPGIDIFSTWNGHDHDYNTPADPEYVTTDRNDWYASWPGTSMAAPVVSGACALYMSVVGHVDPDIMENVLKSTATKLSDKSLGVGVVNVAAMIPDSSKNHKLAIPVIETSESREGTYTELTDGQELGSGGYVRINAPVGATAYSISYTVNGRNPSFKDNEPAPGCFFASPGNPIPVSDLVKNGAPEEREFTLKAVYMTPQGTKSKVKTVNKIRIAKTGGKTKLIIYGSEFVARGKSVKYTAATDPAGMISSGVTWSLSDGTPAGISIDKKTGKVSVKKNIDVNTKFGVIATLNNEADPVKNEYTITVKEPLTGVILGFEDGKEPIEKIYDIKKNKQGGLTSIRLATVNAPGTEIDESRLAISVRVNGAEGYTGDEVPTTLAVSSRPGVAYAEFDDELGSWVIKAGRVPGTAKITWTTEDGSGKKASLSVKTIVPVSNIIVTTKNTQKYVAYGKNAQFIGTPGYTYGKPTISKLTWDYSVLRKYKDDSKKPEDITNEWKQNKLASINTSGKLTVNKKAAEYINENYDINITGKAFSTDGTEIEGSDYVILAPPTQNFIWTLTEKTGDEPIITGWLDKSGSYTTTATLDPKDGSLTNNVIYIYVDTEGTNTIVSEYCMASSSKPRVAMLDEPSVVNVNSDGKEDPKGNPCLKYEVLLGENIRFKVGRTETVKFSFAANDGTGKKNTVTLKIKVESSK